MFIWLLVVFGSAAALGTFALMRPNEIQRLAKRKPNLISEAGEREVVKVAGVVSAEEVLKAPYSGRPCVYYRLEFRQVSAQEESNAFAEDRRAFRIEDESSVAEIDVEGATFNVTCDYVEMERASRLSQRAQDLAAENNWSIFEIAQVTISEGIVEIGSAIDIVGSPVHVPSTQASSQERGYRDLPNTIPVFSAPLLIGTEREPVWIDPPDVALAQLDEE